MQQETDNRFIEHQACPDCGSKDNLARYENGQGYCFGCGRWEAPSSTSIKDNNYQVKNETREVNNMKQFEGNYGEIPDRVLGRDVTKKYGVTLQYGTDGYITKHCYPYYNKDTGEHIGNKIRTVEGKDFIYEGSSNTAGLFGQNIFKEGGKYITITEGEIDAMAVHQMFGNKYAAVSLRSGASGASRDIKNSLEYLESFDTVVLCFDNDKPGEEAVKSVVDLFSPNKIRICKLHRKDASEMLMAGQIANFTRQWWDAKGYTPDGIISSEDTWDILINKKDVISIPYPWLGLNELTHGFRRGELVTVTSGSGMGKSQIARELEHYLLRTTDDNIGVLALEEDPEKTVLGVMSIEANKPLHLHKESTPEVELRGYWEKTMGTGRIKLFDHFGSTSESNLLSKIRYLAKGLDCKWIILDHLSIVVSDQEGYLDERKQIDSVMTKLRQLVAETGIGMFLISHLRRPMGKGHEEGGQISLSELRGSASIAQLSDMVIGLERNQQAEDELSRNTTTVRVLKNRFSGLTGPATTLQYDKFTGRMKEQEQTEF
jgi:twinkle protein